MVSRPYSLLMPLNNQSQQSVLCGLCGGIGSGKSYIARQFQALGAAVFDADQAGHWVLREDDVKKELVSLWGTGILKSIGKPLLKLSSLPIRKDSKPVSNCKRYPTLVFNSNLSWY